MSNRLIPLLLISVILLLIDWYVFKALKTLDKKPKHSQTNTFAYIWWGGSVILILGVFASVYMNLYLTLRAILLVAFVLAFVTKAFYLPFLFLDDIRRGIKWFEKRNTQPLEKSLTTDSSKHNDNISRSDFIVKAGLVVASVPFASLTWGVTSGAYDYQVVRKKLYLKNLPKAFDGITLGQITDIHSGSFYNKTAVRGGVDLLLAQKPDFIFFTGDLVNNDASEMRNYQDIFAKVKAPLGVFSSLGNHDYGEYKYGSWDNPEKVIHMNNLIKTHKNMGWDLLMNQNRKLKVNGEELAIIGVENWGAGKRFPKKAKLDVAMQGVENESVKLLLSHDPSHWRAQVLDYTNIDAMFSGHTHGMQFGVKLKEFQWSPVQYIYKEWAGLYQEHGQQLYVNVGYGFLGYPGRVGILPEITIFELKRA